MVRTRRPEPIPTKGITMPAFARYVGPMEPIPPHLHMEVIALLLRAERLDHKLPKAAVRFLHRLQSEIDEQMAHNHLRDIARKLYPNVVIDKDAIVSRAAEKGKKNGIWVQGWVYLEMPSHPVADKKRTP